MDKEERRLIRQKRRKRNRIIAFAVLFVVLICAAITVFFGAKILINKFGTSDAVDNTEIVGEINDPVEEEKPPIDFTPSESNLEDDANADVEVTPEPTPEPSREELIEEMVEDMIENMTLEEKVAGLFVLTPEALLGQQTVTKVGEDFKNAIEKYPIGGLIFFKSNITSESQIKEMIVNIESYRKYPMFLAIDEEGGDVARVQSALKLQKTKTAKELGAAMDDNLTFETYKGIGEYLSEYGFNTDFAPVGDVLTNPNNKAIGNRSFGDNPQNVANNVSAAVRGLKDANIVTCVKHFPGQGNVDADTHQTLASTAKTRFEMEECELLPFKAAIDVDTDMVMVGHFAAPELTGDNTPCSLSKEVMTDLLRDEIGFKGVVITDALNMGAISEYYGPDEAAIKALKSGADIVLMPENFVQAYEGVINAVHEGIIDEKRIDDSLARIYKIKYRDVLQE